MSRPIEASPERMDDAQEDEVSLLDLLQVVSDNLRLLVLGPLAAGMLAFGVSFAITPTFTAKTLLLPPQQQAGGAAVLLQNLGALGGAAGAAAGLKNPGEQYVAFLKSVSVQDALVTRFKLKERYGAEFVVDARNRLSKNARIVSGTKDGTISVEVDDRDPTLAADIANAHVEELQKLTARLALTEAQQRRQLFEKQLDQTRGKLIKAETALKSTGVNASALKSLPTAAVSEVAQLQAQIAAQEVKIASMRGYLSEGAGDFKQAQVELAALRAQFGKLETTPAASGSSADYVARYRDFKYQETLFDLFARQYELARVDESREGTGMQVIDVATPPEKKSKPSKALIAIVATLASGCVLLLLVFVRQALVGASEHGDTAKKLARLKKSLRSAWR